MVQRLKSLLEGQRSFAFETTASGTNYVKHLKAAKTAGYEISLIFLWLMGPEQALSRVSQRVKQGGHHVPEQDVIRRYYSGIKNLINHYLPLADSALILDNSVRESPQRLIARKNLENNLEILDSLVWGKIEEVAYER